jgi:hypothetical protein
MIPGILLVFFEFFLFNFSKKRLDEKIGVPGGSSDRIRFEFKKTLAHKKGPNPKTRTLLLRVSTN